MVPVPYPAIADLCGGLTSQIRRKTFPPRLHKHAAAFANRTSRVESVDPELLLQARRRRRVLEHQPFVRIDITVRPLRHQRAFMEAAQDELELAGIGVDVPVRKNSSLAGFKAR